MVVVYNVCISFLVETAMCSAKKKKKKIHIDTGFEIRVSHSLFANTNLLELF